MKAKLKKNILNDIEKMKNERSLPNEVEKKIMGRAIANWAIGISINILMMAFMIAANLLSKGVATIIYNVCASIFLIFTLIIIEIGYKKDSGKLAITAIEIMALAVFTLFAPYIFIRISYKTVYGFMAFISAYYIVKIIKIYCSEKKKYLSEMSDITDIIRKESKDELAKQEQEKREEEKKKLQEEEKQTEKKKTSRKTTTTKNKTTTKKANTTAKNKTTTKKTDTTAKSKSTTKKTDTTAKSKPASKKTGTATKSKTTTKKASTTTKKKTVDKESK